EDEHQTPVKNEHQTPVKNEHQTPVKDESQTPIKDEHQTPVEDEHQTSAENIRIQRKKTRGALSLNADIKTKLRSNMSNKSKINGIVSGLASVCLLHGGEKKTWYKNDQGMEVPMSELKILITNHKHRLWEEANEHENGVVDNHHSSFFDLITHIEEQGRDTNLLTNFFYIVVSGMYWAGVKQLCPDLEDDAIMPINVKPSGYSGGAPHEEPIEIILTQSYFHVLGKVQNVAILNWMHTHLH
ncbi:hypothetical protein GGI15_004189, partial [Coemansia interrupta]